MSKLIDIDLTQQDIDSMIQIYVQRNLRPESIEVFNENLRKGMSEALYRAILNDSIVMCIEAARESEKAND